MEFLYSNKIPLPDQNNVMWMEFYYVVLVELCYITGIPLQITEFDYVHEIPLYHINRILVVLDANGIPLQFTTHICSFISMTTYAFYVFFLISIIFKIADKHIFIHNGNAYEVFSEVLAAIFFHM